MNSFYYLPFSLKLLVVYEWSYDFFLVDKKKVITWVQDQTYAHLKKKKKGLFHDHKFYIFGIYQLPVFEL